MTNLYVIAFFTALHVLAAVVWVGGMFFAYLVLRPSAQELEPPARLKLWLAVFRRFFAWVWLAVIVILSSGFVNIYMINGGFAGLPLPIHIMTGLGLLMTAIFTYVYVGPYAAFAGAVNGSDLQRAAGLLGKLRRLFAINMTLGLITAVIGATARYMV